MWRDVEGFGVVLDDVEECWLMFFDWYIVSFLRWVTAGMVSPVGCDGWTFGVSLASCAKNAHGRLKTMVERCE